MSNIYYNPEHYGLEVVAEIEYSNRCYQFDTRVVWKQNSTNKLFTARDSGCSCPTPFEDYNMTNIDLVNFDILRAEVLQELSSEFKNISHESAHNFLDKVRAEL